MTVYREVVTVTGATGGAGAATANASTSQVVQGTVRAIYLEYTGSPPAGTTDVTIVEKTNTHKQTVLSIANAATDAWFYPMAQAQTAAGAAITNQGAPIVVNDHLVVTIAQANDADGVKATIVWEC